MTPYLLGLYEKSMPGTLTIPEKLTETKQAGFDFLELSIDETDEKLARLEWDREEVHQVLDAMWEIELPIRSICLSGHRKYPMGHPDSHIRDRSLQILEKALCLADSLGVRTSNWRAMMCTISRRTRKPVYFSRKVCILRPKWRPGMA